LWFRKRTVEGIVILDALRGRKPKPEDIERLCELLVQPGTPLYLAVNLSQAEIVDSRFVASLVGLRERLLAANGKLVLHSLCHGMREVLRYTGVDRLFFVFDTEEDALRSLRSMAD